MAFCLRIWYGISNVMDDDKNMFVCVATYSLNPLSHNWKFKVEGREPDWLGVEGVNSYPKEGGLYKPLHSSLLII